MNTHENEADLLTKQLFSGDKRKTCFKIFGSIFSGATQKWHDYYVSNRLRLDLNNCCESGCNMI